MEAEHFNLPGLDVRAETVYLAMLARPRDGVVELSERLGLSTKEVRRALDRLSALALVRNGTEDESRPHAVDPQLGMEILIARERVELAAQQQRVEASREAAAKLISQYSRRRDDASSTYMTYLDGIEAIRDHLAAINDEVREEFLAFSPGGPQTPANMRASRELNSRLLARGVRMRTIYLDSIRRDPATLDHIAELTAQGADVRTVPALPNRMIIYDRRGVLIAFDSTDTAAGAVRIAVSGVIDAMRSLFELTWAGADPIAATPRPAPGALNRQQHEVVRLLAQGATDESIGNRLGVSARTARRMTNSVLAHLNARSRFQAGVHAVQQGYLPDDPG